MIAVDEIDDLKAHPVLGDPGFIAVCREMQTTPCVLAEYEYDEAMKHLRRARAFLRLDQQSIARDKIIERLDHVFALMGEK
jgi:hypothetical protein